MLLGGLRDGKEDSIFMPLSFSIGEGEGHIASPLSVRPVSYVRNIQRLFLLYNGPGWGHLCHTGTFVDSMLFILHIHDAKEQVD